MFGTEQMSRRCLIELSDGSKILAILTIPKPTKPIFPEKMKREFIESFNKSQPNMINKVVKCHVMRN